MGHEKTEGKDKVKEFKEFADTLTKDIPYNTSATLIIKLSKAKGIIHALLTDKEILENYIRELGERE
ncbi:hypothetical protein EVB79_016 [Rhizobium phage RHph_N3_13]|nr:hypothetical protein EVB79_016 [Rhizobium phage RHph_N3_13]